MSPRDDPAATLTTPQSGMGLQGLGDYRGTNKNRNSHIGDEATGGADDYLYESVRCESGYTSGAIALGDSRRGSRGVLDVSPSILPLLNSGSAEAKN